MKTSIRILSIFAVVALLALAFATPAAAFDGRTGDRIVIEADEVIEDDLYVSAGEFILEGTVKGDLIVGAQSVTINGTVEGDLIAGAQVIVINGTVTDDVRIAAAAHQVGETAQIGSDLIAMGASLEVKEGSIIGGEVVTASGQVLLAGEVAGDVLAATGALELSGTFGGNVQAYVDVTDETASAPPMNMYMSNMPIAIPNLQPGLTVTDDADIAGDLAYTSTIDLPIPAGIVAGEVIRTTPEVTRTREVAPTPAQRVGSWAFDLLRGMLTLILFGLLLAWLFPVFMKVLPAKIQSQPWATLGWGAIAWAAFFFALLAIVLVMILGGLLFGFLTLGGVSGTIIWLGILTLIAFIILFVLVTSYLTKIVVGEVIGKWILNRINPALAEHRVWPMVVGIVVLVLIVGLFSFPLLPIGFFGWLINFLVILCGLGALWLWGRDRFTKMPVVSSQ